MIAFLVLLIAFEVAREFAVVAAATPPKPGVVAAVTQRGENIEATGRWNRLGKGKQEVPTAVTIVCSSSKGTCIEATTNFYDFNNKMVGPPLVEEFPATFSDNQITYLDDTASCYEATVSIDLELERVTSHREATPNNIYCQGSLLDPPSDESLTDGNVPVNDLLDGH